MRHLRFTLTDVRKRKVIGKAGVCELASINAVAKIASRNVAADLEFH